ncbi:MAG: hypothetical protein ACFB00_12870 [Parvularculaceae bacterium]
MAIVGAAFACSTAAAQIFEPPPPRPGPGAPTPKVGPKCPSGLKKTLIVDKNNTGGERYETIKAALDCVSRYDIRDAVIEVYATPTDEFPEPLKVTRPDTTLIGYGGPFGDGPVFITPPEGQECVVVDIPRKYDYRKVTTRFENFIFAATTDGEDEACIHVKRGKLTLLDSRINVTNARGTGVLVDATSWFTMIGRNEDDHGVFTLVPAVSDRNVVGVRAVGGSASVEMRNVRVAGLEVGVTSNSLRNTFDGTEFQDNRVGIEIKDHAVALEFAPALDVRGGLFERNADAIIVRDRFSGRRADEGAFVERNRRLGKVYPELRQVFRNHVRIGDGGAPRTVFRDNYRGLTIEAAGLQPIDGRRFTIENARFERHQAADGSGDGPNAASSYDAGLDLCRGANDDGPSYRDERKFKSYAVCFYSAYGTAASFDNIEFFDNRRAIHVQNDFDGRLTISGASYFLGASARDGGDRQRGLVARAGRGYLDATITSASGLRPAFYLGGDLSNAGAHRINVDDATDAFDIVQLDPKSALCTMSLGSRKNRREFDSLIDGLNIFLAAAQIGSFPFEDLPRNEKKRQRTQKDILCGKYNDHLKRR